MIETTMKLDSKEGLYRGKRAGKYLPVQGLVKTAAVRPVTASLQ